MGRHVDRLTPLLYTRQQLYVVRMRQSGHTVFDNPRQVSKLFVPSVHILDVSPVCPVLNKISIFVPPDPLLPGHLQRRHPHRLERRLLLEVRRLRRAGHVQLRRRGRLRALRGREQFPVDQFESAVCSAVVDNVCRCFFPSLKKGSLEAADKQAFLEKL